MNPTPIIVLRLVIVDAPPKNGKPPKVHRHNYVYRGFDALDQTLEVAVMEHAEAFAFDGAGFKVAECHKGCQPHWFCVPHVEESQ